MKIRYGIVILTMIIFILSCTKNEELQHIESLYETAQNSTQQMKIQDTAAYVLAIVLYQQKIVSENPKRIDTELLNTAIEFVETLQMNDNNALEDKLLNINTATLYMMLSAYSNAKGDLVQAVGNVDRAFTIFDSLMVLYPDDLIVRGYRGINYSALPDIFGKEKIIDSDFMFVYNTVHNTDIETLDSYTIGVLPHIFNAAIRYYSKNDDTNKLAMFTDILERVNNKEGDTRG